LNDGTNPKIDILDLDMKELSAWLTAQGIKPFHAKQIFKWVFCSQEDTFSGMTDLSKALRSSLDQWFFISRLTSVKTEYSSDGTRKYLLQLKDGHHIETVLIPESDHYTLCISTQVGCAQGCRFCLTASGGFIRNLSRAEIIAQVRDVQKDLSRDAPRLTNIVIMGMGEPLANYRNVVSAINTLVDGDFGLKFSSRRLTLSTVGLVPRLYDLGRDTAVNLAVSLNATDNKTRDMLMPVNRNYPVEKLIEACRTYPLKPRRRITFEYILIKGVNDGVEDAHRLAKLLRPIKAKINLIPFNEHEGCDFQRPEESVILKFQDILANNNFTAMIRYSKGGDISAACGQLRARLKKADFKLSDA